MIRINLLSEGKRPAAVRKARPGGLQPGNLGNWLLLLGAIIGGAVFAVEYYLANQRLEEKQAEVAQAQHEVDMLQAVIKEVEDFKAKEFELQRKIKIISDLKLNQRGPVRIMDYVSRALPELLWLDHMRVTNGSIELEGRAFNYNAEATFLENLEKVPEFKEPTLKDSTQQAFGIYRFVMNCDYTFAPPTPKTTPGGAAATTPGGPATPPSSADSKPRSPAAGR
jgi:Tfp pilus assembly protein PilN